MERSGMGTQGDGNAGRDVLAAVLHAGDDVGE